MNITTTVAGNQVVFAIEGRIDTSTAPQLEQALETLGDATSLVMDFEKVEYISSAGLRVILKAQKLMNAKGDMKLIHVNADVKEVFEITGFLDIICVE